MIVVTGATGQLGRLVIHHLLQRVPAERIVAAVRSPEKAVDLAELGVQVRHADYDKPSTLDSALAEAEKVLLISSSEVGHRVAQHQAVIDAATRAGVRLLAYTSLLHADDSPLGLAEEHRQTEAAIRASGLPAVLLRNGWYHENFTASIQHDLQLGAHYGSSGDGRISAAARNDYAEAAARVLTAEQLPVGRIYELAGDDGFSLSEFAAEVSRQSGQNIPYRNIPTGDYQAALLKAGLPTPVAELVADCSGAAASGTLFDDSRELSRLLGRPTTSLGEAVKVALG